MTPHLHRLAALLAVASLAGCKVGGDEAAAAGDTPAPDVSTVSAGAIDTADILRLDGVRYALTDSVYDRWRTASQRLAQLPEDRSTINPHVEHLRAIDAEDVDNTIRNLESDSDARRAITSSGLRVREYINATLALHQALSVADSATRHVRWQNVPTDNIVFAQERKAEIERLRINRRFQVVDDDPDDPEDARELRDKVRRRQERARGRS